MSKRILIVEDEIDIAELLKAQLMSKGLNATAVHTGNSAKEIIEKNADYDLFLIDWMLPSLSGIELCNLIRSQKKTKDVPIIMVTALTQADNIIQGLDAGADDYITKPFDMDVLLARVRAQLRRRDLKQQTKSFKYHDLSINLESCAAYVKDKELPLTHTEFQILTSLAKKPGCVFTREQLITEIIGSDVHVTPRTIDTHMAGLRKKLGEYSTVIKTIRGIGYRFIEIDS